MVEAGEGIEVNWSVVKKTATTSKIERTPVFVVTFAFLSITL